MRLALSIPFAEILAFPKLGKAYFAFFEVLFRNHITAVLSLSTPVFLQVGWTAGDPATPAAETPLLTSMCVYPVMQVIQAQHEGLQSVGKSAWHLWEAVSRS